MFNKKHNMQKWWGVPPWVLIGAVLVLLPIFAVSTLMSINRQKDKSTQLLLEKGAALIRSFEAGTRTGMMGMGRGGFRLQHLLTETAQQPDIVYLFVADIGGKILAHNDLGIVGSILADELDLEHIARQKTLQWRQVSNPDGTRIFEVFQIFQPAGPPKGMMRRHRMMGQGFETRRREMEHLYLPEIPKLIFVGLDMSSIEEAHAADIRHAIIMGIILLLVGFSGITLLFVIQNYRSTRASLSRIKAFSDNVVENLPIGLIALDDKGRIAAFNHTAEVVLQQPFQEIIGKDAEKILPPELYTELKSLEIQNQEATPTQPVRLPSQPNASPSRGRGVWEEVSEKGSPDRPVVEKEISCTVGEGKTVPLEIGASVLEDENRTFLGHVILFKDLTEVRMLRREIERSRRLASVGSLAAGVAHEIRNPLSSIKGFATYFKERYQHVPEDSETANIMIQEVDRLNRVVSQLLEFTRPVKISPLATSLSRLIEDSLRLVQQKARYKQITISYSTASDENEVLVDPDRINQVLLNLYLNAIESMSAGGELSVKAGVEGNGKSIEIQVSDTGGGIDQDDLTKIFDPYYTTKTSGTGLGLAIAHNIVEAMGGAITVTSQLGKGTTFRLILPIRDKPKKLEVS
jgi:two-component system sensor histidine kinase HydH